MRDITVASVQFNHAPGDKAANWNIMESFIEEAAADGVEILVFPEMCITGYWHIRNFSREQVDALAERIPDGPSTDHLRELAQEYRMTIGAGLIERGISGRLFNSYVVAMPDGSYARHRKLHCFLNEHLSSGEEFTVFDTPHGCTCGILICYDNNIIENVRLTALQGAEILIAPHQTGGCLSRSPHAMGLIEPALWENREADPEAIEAEFKGPKGREWLLRWLPARAHDNGMFLIFSNGVGYDDGEVRTGNAMILDPYGRILNETWVARDAMVTARLEADLLNTSTGRRWLRARRPELYAPLAKRTGREVDPRTARFT